MSEDATTPTARLRVLVVENHEDSMRALTFYLRQLGHSVHGAGSVGEALGVLPRQRFDLLLSDIGLPDGDGWELLERAHLPATTHCVAMSGFGLSADCARSKAVGFRHHLQKPLDPAALDRVLEEAMQARPSPAHC